MYRAIYSADRFPDIAGHLIFPIEKLVGMKLGRRLIMVPKQGIRARSTFDFNIICVHTCFKACRSSLTTGKALRLATVFEREEYGGRGRPPRLHATGLYAWLRLYESEPPIISCQADTQFIFQSI